MLHFTFFHSSRAISLVGNTCRESGGISCPVSQSELQPFSRSHVNNGNKLVVQTPLEPPVRLLQDPQAPLPRPLALAASGAMRRCRPCAVGAALRDPQAALPRPCRMAGSSICTRTSAGASWRAQHMLPSLFRVRLRAAQIPATAAAAAAPQSFYLLQGLPLRGGSDADDQREKRGRRRA